MALKKPAAARFPLTVLIQRCGAGMSNGSQLCRKTEMGEGDGGVERGWWRVSGGGEGLCPLSEVRCSWSEKSKVRLNVGGSTFKRGSLIQ